MRRDLLITALIFTALGFAGGVVFSRYSDSASPSADASLSAFESGAGLGGSELPEGHPPLDLAKRWQDLKQRADASPNDPHAARELADFLYDVERWQDAVFWYRRALELDPKNTDARTDLATCYFQMGQFDQAAAEYSNALELEPNKPQALFGLAMVRLRGQNDREAARRLYEQLRRSHPNFEGVAQLAAALGEGQPRP
jgi:tetratricopeptide (TPR) repeat protein